MRRHKLIGLTSSLVALRQVDIHLVSIKVSIVRAAVSVVHANGLLLWQDLGQMRHHGRLVQGWLAVYE